MSRQFPLEATKPCPLSSFGEHDFEVDCVDRDSWLCECGWSFPKALAPNREELAQAQHRRWRVEVASIEMRIPYKVYLPFIDMVQEMVDASQAMLIFVSNDSVIETVSAQNNRAMYELGNRLSKSINNVASVIRQQPIQSMMTQLARDVLHINEKPIAKP